MHRDTFGAAFAAILLFSGVIGAGLTAGGAAAAADGVLDILFDAPHRVADSMMDMPAIGPVEAPFRAALDAAAGGDLAAARQQAAAAGYAIVEKSEGGRGYFILMERDRAGVGPTVAIARNPVRDVVIEAPHPIIDRYSDREAAVLFLKLGARALVLSGANRCAAKEVSACSGKTRVCGDGSNPYRTSDPAHNPATLFQVAHLDFSRRWPRSIVFQPHGFGDNGSSVWFMISDGSTEKRPGDDRLTGRVRDGLRAALGADRAVSCQDPNDRDIKTRWLCATTTVQGRDLNGSGDICRKNAGTASGRFLHIEQTYDEVRKGFGEGGKDLSGYPGSAAILTVLAKEFPCINAGCTPVQ
jgi:hypothetical protein